MQMSTTLHKIFTLLVSYNRDRNKRQKYTQEKAPNPSLGENLGRASGFLHSTIEAFTPRKNRSELTTAFYTGNYQNLQPSS